MATEETYNIGMKKELNGMAGLSPSILHGAGFDFLFREFAFSMSEFH